LEAQSTYSQTHLEFLDSWTVTQALQAAAEQEINVVSFNKVTKTIDMN